MSIHVVCSACNETVAAPETMAGKKAVCPNCRAIIAIPEQFVPARVVDPGPAVSEPASEHHLPATLDIGRAPVADTLAADEKAALHAWRLIYVFFRDDWRRLLTCPHLWFSFLFFFLPWVNISCAGRAIVSQSGLQTAYGAWSVDPKLDAAQRNNAAFGNSNAAKPNLNEAPAWSVLSVVYITFIFLGGFCGLLCMIFVVLRLSAFAAALHLFSLGLGAAAFLALGSQMVIGFPLERHMKQQIEKQRADQARNNQFAVRPMDDGSEFWFEVKYTGWLWLSFALSLFCVPVFLLEFAILITDAVRKHMRQSADSG